MYFNIKVKNPEHSQIRNNLTSQAQASINDKNVDKSKHFNEKFLVRIVSLIKMRLMFKYCVKLKVLIK